MTMTTLRHLDNNTLIDTLGKLARSEREATAELLACLAEVEHRKLYAQRGYPSMFKYCLKVLHMAEPSIYVRIAAARCCRKFPDVLRMLRVGELHLSAIKLLAPHLTDENQQSLLAKARHKSKRRVEELVSDLAPKPDAGQVVRKLPAPQAPSSTPAPKTAGASVAPQDAPQTTSELAAAAAPEKQQAPHARAQAPAKTVSRPEPLGQSRFKVVFTADARLRSKIEQAQDLTRHKNPSGDLPALFEAALDQLIAAENKRQHGATTRRPAAKREPANKEPANKEPAKPAKRSRHIPNSVKREVFARDGGQCTFVSADGRRCSERGGLQYHHEIPYAKGGANTADNIRLACRCHNALHARLDYGAQWMAARVQSAKDGRSPGARSTPASIDSRLVRDNLAAASKAYTQVPLAVGGP
jgi:hypothetical protein